MFEKYWHVAVLFTAVYALGMGVGTYYIADSEISWLSIAVNILIFPLVFVFPKLFIKRR